VDFNFKIFRGKIILSFASILFVCGCGGGSDAKGTEVVDENNSSEIWHFQDTNLFFSIGNDGETKVYRCSLYDGFVEDNTLSGFRDGSELEMSIEGGEIQRYLIDENQNLIIGDNLTPYSVVSEVPAVCTDDAIEITYYTPIETSVGVEVEFLVNFDYRFTGEEAVIELGFTSDEDGSYTISQQDSYEVSSSGIGSGSISVSHSPIFLGDSIQYYLHINMDPIDPGNEFYPFATDKKLISILQLNESL